MTYPFLIFGALFFFIIYFFLLFFSELSNGICLRAAGHVCPWDEAAGTKPEMKWADFGFAGRRQV